MNRRKNLIILILALFIVMIGCMGYKEKVSAATVYFSVEKFTIGQGYVVEPVEVTIEDNALLSETTERVLTQAGYTYKVNSSMYGWYLSGINDADIGEGTVPQCIQNMAEDAPKTEDLYPADQKNKKYPGLYEYSYTMYAGWMFYPNNQDMSVGAGSYYLKDGDVVRLRFTLYGIGADLDNGREGSLSLPNLDAVTKRMAIYNANKKACDLKGYSSIYNNVKSVITNMDSTSDEIEEAYSKLPSEEEMRQWGAELAEEEKKAAEKKAAEEKAAREKAAEQTLIKKYTPAKVKLSSVKKERKNTAKITWKKVKSCTGYQIYMSMKKNSGFKKIKTLKGYKKVTYKRTKLKKKKTYYFKVRAYCSAGGKNYYGAFSNVKKLKMK